MRAHPIICTAIRSLTLLEFEYEGHQRVVAPYLHGETTKNVEAVRAIQVRGTSRSGGLGVGKLWALDKMRNLRSSKERFIPSDPNYNPDDSAMLHIHCRV